MTLVKYSPVAPAFSRNFFDDFFIRDFFHNSPSRTFSNPAFTVSKTEKGHKIEAALPGLKRSDLKVEIDNDMLVIAYKKNEEEGNPSFVGEFTQKYSLPETIDQDNVSATMENGILTIELANKPEAAKPAPRTIEIR